MRILVSGITGHMGHEVCALAKAGMRGAEVVGGIGLGDAGGLDVPVAQGFEAVDEALAGVGADVIVDFSHHSWTEGLLQFACARKLPVVIATTGQTAEERDAIFAAAERIPIFFAANFSLGVALLVELAKKAAATMPDAEIEIIEKHHNRKLDAPSGTAIALANAINEARGGQMHAVCGRSGQAKRQPAEIGISSVRMGNIVGEHEVLISTQNETITLKHEAHSRALFAEGALAAAQFVVGCEPGMYNMHDLTK
ncbi:MAG: 4-hydroxy-tetrahydrodipicolinate reductase [Eggerthellaceae bacterium]|nr:4-hydroxy-tetrahydrodipicolinate reductase [Eggerthellaceae bacterium]